MISFAVKYGKILLPLAVVLGIAGSLLYMQHMRTSLRDYQEELARVSQEKSDAKEAAEKAARQAHELVKARDKAHADRLAAERRIQGEVDMCLLEPLPLGLLD